MTDRSKSCWWLADRSIAAERVTAMANTLLDAYGRELRRKMHAFRAVYLNEDHPDFDRMGYVRGSKYPVTQGGVDSLHAKLALSRPRPKIVPGSRRFKAKRRSKQLQRWIDGLFKLNATDKLQDDQLHDAEIYGAGVIKALVRHGKVVHERRHPGDILTDPREERRSAVRSLFEVANLDREMLAESEFIDGSAMRKRVLDVDAPPEQEDAGWHDSGVALDQVKVIEAWRLPSSPSAPGRHVMAVGDIVLLDEEWEWDCFPFSVLVWGRDPERTMQGQGIVERGLRVQSMLNHHCAVIDESFERFVPKMGAPRTANIDASVIDRKVGQWVEWDGPLPPQVLSPGPISPDFLAYAQELANRWFAVTGVSQMDARSEADPVLESGKAKLVQADINSGRFYAQGKGRERACVTLAELSIKLADYLCDHMGKDEERETDEERRERQSMTVDSYATEPGQLALAPADDEDAEEPAERPMLEVPAGRDSWRETIPYEAARMKGKGDEAYAIEVFPVSSLSQTVAGRMEEVNQLVSGGYITNPDTARELLDLPLLNEFQDLASARREAAEREIDRCLDAEQGIPSAYMDLNHALERATQEYCLAGIDEAPDDVLDCLRSFIGATEALIAKQNPPPAPVDPMAGMPPTEPAPPAMPMMPAGPMAAVA